MSEYYDAGFDVDAYLASRPRYPACIYDRILGFHVGRTERLLDLGCGPGQASWPLLDHFDTIVGLDPGEKMVQSAQSALKDLERKRAKSYQDRVQYRVGSAEKLDGIEDGSIDVVVAGTAAHWFEYEKMWQEVQRVTRKGSTVAFWTYDIAYPKEHGSLAKMVSDSAYVDLKPLLNEPGSSIIRSLYRKVPLPADTNAWEESSLQTYPVSEDDFVPVLPPQRGKEGNWELLFEDVTMWKELEAVRRTNSSYLNWCRLNPGVSQEQDIASMQVGAMRAAVLKERKEQGIGTEEGLDDEHVRMMRPMGLLLLRRC